MIGNVNRSELRAMWAAFFTLRQKILDLSKQCRAIEEGQIFYYLTPGFLAVDIGCPIVGATVPNLGPPWLLQMGP
jgi:hypothetical protein